MGALVAAPSPGAQSLTPFTAADMLKVAIDFENRILSWYDKHLKAAMRPATTQQ